MRYPSMVNVDDERVSKVDDLLGCQKSDAKDVGKGKKGRKRMKSYY